jgi:hypothetical protein
MRETQSLAHRRSREGQGRGAGSITKRNPMKPNQLATLVLRLIGVYTLVEAIPLLAINLTSAVFIGEPTSSGPSRATFGAWLILPAVFRIMIGIFLLMRAEALAQKLTPQEVSDKDFTPVSFEQVQVLAFAVVGVLIFAEALSQLFNNLFSILVSLNQIITKNDAYHSQAYNWRTLLTAVGALAKAVLGLWMFFGARGFSNFWRSLRIFGTPKQPQS